MNELSTANYYTCNTFIIVSTVSTFSLLDIDEFITIHNNLNNLSLEAVLSTYI